MEDRTSEVDMVHSDSKDLHALQLQVKSLKEKAINTENRLRRNNIHILCLPEKAEGSKQAVCRDIAYQAL